MILGLDISTKCIGWCLLKNDGSFYNIGYVWLQNLKSEEAKWICFWDELTLILPEDELVDDVYVEAPLFGSNNQNIVNLLQRWNGMCCVAVYQRTSCWPKLVSEYNVRKELMIKVPKGTKGLGKKKFVLKYVQSLGVIPEDVWEYKKTGNPKDFCFDMADSYLVARAGYEKDKSKTTTST